MSSKRRNGSPSKGSEDAREQSLLATAKALQFDLDDLRDEDGRKLRGDDPYALRAELSEAWISAALKDSEANTAGGGLLAGSLTQQGDGTVLLQAELRCLIGVACARCLEDSGIEAGGQLCLSYVPEGQEFGADGVEGADGLELTSDALDETTYSGRTLDLAETMREQLLLAIPMKPLCGLGDECRGLCGRCGQDLNKLDPCGENCPACGLALVDGVEDIQESGVHETKPGSAWQSALSKFSSEDPE